MMPEPASEAVNHPAASELASRLQVLAIHLLRRLRRADAALGISAARLSVLSVIGHAGPHTLGELAAAEQVTPPTMTRLIASLERDGLVTRTIDAGDRRVARIAVTPKGRELLDWARSRRTEHLAGPLRTLDAEDLAILERAAAILEQVVNSIA